MEQFWKWLMKMDARGIFVVSVILFLAAGTWSAFTIVHAGDEPLEVAPPSSKAPSLTFNPYQPVGVIGFVSNQFTAETLVLSINPFHPTFESIVRSYVARNGKTGEPLLIRGRDGRIVAPKERREQPPSVAGAGSAPGGDPRPGVAARPGQRGTRTPQAGQQGQRQGQPGRPPATIAFKGVMQRPDGKFASYVHDNEKGPFFVVVGDKIRNAKVVASGKDGVELEFPNGLRVSLGLGDPPWVIGEEGRE